MGQLGVVNSSSFSGGCPFSGAKAGEGYNNGEGRCPFAVPAAPPAPVPAASQQLDERTADAARALSERGISSAQISMLLQVDEVAVSQLTAQSHVGRVLGSTLQEKLDDLLTEDSDLCCPISLVLLSDPVVASDGFIYEKASLEEVLRSNAVSPMTRQTLEKHFFPAQERKTKALEFREMRSKELLAFADDAITAGQQQIAGEAVERVVAYINDLAAGSCTSIETKVGEVYSKLGRPAPLFRASP